ncbi:transporter [Micromonospora sp. NBC_01699]|uniref:transporter n=1 Tax=Micromonospora sp. NBC_01699 TaxID=2975984 RepID=UPI002E2B6C42|nr:transporter [Micromonospora sp. NBC_01699]
MALSDDDEQPLASAAETLLLIRQQQAEAARQLNPDPRLIYWPWGVAWLVGFGLFFLRFGPDHRVFVDLPEWLPLTTLFVLLGAAGALSAITGARSYGQITGDSARRGQWYGFAWLIGFASYGIVLSRVTDHLPDDLARLLWAAAAVGLTGVLHVAGGAIWLDRNLLRLGIWLSVINIVGVYAGPGWHALIVAVAGGGGMLIGGTITWLGRRNRS